MGRKKIHSIDVMVYACKQYLNIGRSYLSIAKEFGVNKSTIMRWVRIYEVHGAAGFAHRPKNNSYSRDFKKQVISEYYTDKPIAFLAGKYNISYSVIAKWINRYNEGKEIADYDPKPEVYQMKTRRTTKEEKLAIVLYCLDNNKNYKLAAEKYGINYQSVRGWVVRYLAVGHDEFMNSKQGRKPLSPTGMSEVERLAYELKREKEKNARLARTIETLKKNEKIDNELKSKVLIKRKT